MKQNAPKLSTVRKSACSGHLLLSRFETGIRSVFLGNHLTSFAEKISMPYSQLFEKCANRVSLSLASFGLVMTMGTASLYAQDYGLANANSQSPWSVSLGAGIMAAPEFEGSDKYEARFLPLVHVEYMNRFFLSTHDGLGAFIVNRPEWQLGVVAKYNPGRDQDDSSLLDGLGDIDPGVELGGFAAWTPGPYAFKLTALQGVGDVEGFQLKASAGHSFEPIKSVRWTNSVETTFANSTYNDTFFGISEKQSQRSRYQTYDAGNGIKDVSFNTGVSWGVTDAISLKTFGQYKRLTGPAADSPLVKAGSSNQWALGAGVVYAFGK